MARWRFEFDLDPKSARDFNLVCDTGYIGTDLDSIKLGYIQYYRDAQNVENI